MYISQNSFRICKTCWFASLLTSSLPACILCSTAIASLLFCSAMLPTTCQTVPPSWCHTRVGADRGGMQSPAGRQAPGQVPTSPPAPSHPRLQPCVQTSGKAHSQPSSATHRFSVQIARTHFHLTIRRQMWFGISPFSQFDILLPTVGAEGRP